jgi:hypothetical protein
MLLYVTKLVIARGILLCDVEIKPGGTFGWATVRRNNHPQFGEHSFHVNIVRETFPTEELARAQAKLVWEEYLKKANQNVKRAQKALKQIDSLLVNDTRKLLLPACKAFKV